MKKISKICCALGAVFLLGCSTPSPTTTTSPTTTPTASVSGDMDAYASYEAAFNRTSTYDSYRVAFQASNDFTFEDTTKQTYDLDGVLSVSGATGEPIAQMSENIYANGMSSSMQMYYLDGVIYNTFNSVSYQETASFDQFVDGAMVQLAPHKFSQDQIQSLTVEETEEGTVYTIVLKPESVNTLFANRYDLYEMSAYDDWTITSNQITQTYDAQGNYIAEEAVFDCSFSFDGSPVIAIGKTSIHYVDVNDTKVEIDEPTKQTLTAFVPYQEIDTNSIAQESNVDDTPGVTAEETFQKRLLSRLNYTLEENGTYGSVFNETEAYTVDFANSLFTYSNRTITYMYNWKSNQGGYDTCVYDFSDGSSNSACDASAIETIQNVKKYFEMELYYCGLSLSDLQKSQ